jgi:hypothetical protein
VAAGKVPWRPGVRDGRLWGAFWVRWAGGGGRAYSPPRVRYLLVPTQKEKREFENSRENPDLDRDPDSVEIEISSLKQVIGLLYAQVRKLELTPTRREGRRIILLCSISQIATGVPYSASLRKTIESGPILINTRCNLHLFKTN